MKNLLQDIRFSLRQIIRYPGFVLATVLTLAFGIGTNTAIFSMIRGVLLRPLPYAHGDRLVHIGYRDPSSELGEVEFSVQEMQELQARKGTLASIEEYHSMTFTLLGQGEPDRVRTGVVSASFFDHFGVKPFLGRSFAAGEGQPGAEPVLLLAYPYWRRHFSADPGIIGKSVILDGKSVRVVGVLPPIPQFPEENDVFVAPVACSTRSSDFVVGTRKVRMLSLFGLLNPGVTAARAHAEIATVIGGWRQQYPDLYPKEKYDDVPVVPVQEELTAHFKPTLFILFAMVGLVLLIACFNVANLTLARMMQREREVAVRSALGAGRGRLMAQLLTESTVLALLGGAAGLLLAYNVLGLLTTFAGRFTPRAYEITIDGQVLLFTFLLSGLTGLLFGLFPAFQTSVQNAASALKAGGRSTVSAAARRFRSLLTIAQVAISFILLIGAGLAVRSLLNLQRVDTGFALKNGMAMTISLDSSRTPEEVVSFFESLLARVETIPGVTAAGVGGELPLESDDFRPTFDIEGRTASNAEEQRAQFGIATAGFFKALQIPLRGGRLMTPADRKNAPPVIVINEAFAHQYWPTEDPIGKRLTLKSRGGGGGVLRTVVGVVGDVKQRGLTRDTGPGFYLSFYEVHGRGGKLFFRTAGDPGKVVSQIVAMIRQLDPTAPVTDIVSLEQVRDRALAPARLTAILLALLAILACTIAVLGIGAVVASSVSERTHEIGIRSALGAGRGKMLSSVLWQGLTPVLAGLGLGALVALWFSRFLSSILFGVMSTDTSTYVAIAALLLAVSVLACLVPARRAMAIDPCLALRYD